MFENYGKRALSLLMALIMVVSMVPAQVFATDLEEPLDHEHCEVCGQHDCSCPPVAAEHEHDFVRGDVIPASCGSDGYTVYYCTGCDARESRDEVPATGDHNFEAGEVVDPGCGIDGYTVYTCSECRETKKGDVIPATGSHELVAGQMVAPTCGKAGYTVYTCPDCGESENRDEVPATGAHTFAAGTPVEATCEEKGYTPYTCSVCGKTENRDEVKALGHAYETVVVDPTADAQGYTEHTCSRCGDTYKDNFTDFETETEVVEHEIPEDWTDEMAEIQAEIDAALTMYLCSYGFKMPDEAAFVPVIQAMINGEEIPAELEAEWETLCAEIEAVFADEMDDNVRENARAAAETVDGLMMWYLEDEYLTEEQCYAIGEANPVWMAFAELAYEYGVSRNLFTTQNPIDGVEITDDKDKLTLKNGVVTAKATAGFRSTTNTLTITNTSSNTATIAFDYSFSNGDGLSGFGISITSFTESASGSGSAIVSAGGSETLALKSRGTWQGDAVLNLSNITITPVAASSNVTVAYDGSLGSVTVAGSPVAANGVAEISSSGAALVATPNGSTFLGWTDSDGKILSTAATYTLIPASDMTINAIFAKDGGNAVFAIGTTTDKSHDEKKLSSLWQGTEFPYKVVTHTHLFDDLEAALTAAQNSSSKAVVLMNNGTITGNYTIPSGVTLLIPCDAAGTLSGTNPVFKGEVDDGKPRATITAYKTLTMAPGSSITVAKGGVMNVNAVLFTIGGSEWGGGSPMDTYGYVVMQGEGVNKSAITVQSGGALYCYGYINGTGTVTVQNGGKVYEVFQFEDFRGGTLTTTLSQKPIGTEDGGGFFPLSDYYVQNVMVPLTLEAGATEGSYAAIYMSSASFGTGIEFISGSNAMFNLKSGSVTKRYDASRDRIIFDINGKVEIAGISMTIEKITMDSADFVLPINSNITININSGSDISVQQEVALLPGAEINVAAGANCTLVDGGALYLYDIDDWGPYVGALPQQFIPSYFVPGRGLTVHDSNGYVAIGNVPSSYKKPAQITVKGSVTAAGKVFTTAGGAAIIGTEGAVVRMSPATEGLTYQHNQTNYIEFSTSNGKLTSAKLLNGDGSYFSTANDTPKDANGNYYPGYYIYENAKWNFRCKDNIHTPGAAATCGDPQVCTVCGVEVAPATGNHTNGPAATCDTAQTCTVCGDVIKEALGHSTETIPGKAATCYATGLTDGVKCNREGCGKILTAQTEIAKIAHTYQSPSSTVDPTCTEAGSKTYKCTVCQDAFDHNKITEAEIGTKTEPVPATGHLNVNPTPQVDATCDQDGVKAHYFCGTCQTYYATSNSEDHKNLSDKIGNTEALAAWKTGDGKIEALGHNTVNENTANEVSSTCTVPGTKAYWYCSNCETYYSDVACTSKIENLEEWKTGDGRLALADHTVVTVPEVPATCLAAGTKAGTKCSVCDEVINGCEEIPQKAHSGIHSEQVDSECEKDGYKEYYSCQNGCGLHYSDAAYTTVIGDGAQLITWKNTDGQGKIPATGHHNTVVIPAVDATCTTAGSTAGVKCTDCGKTLVEPQNIPAACKPGDPEQENYDETTKIYDSVVYCTVCKEEISRTTIIPGEVAEHDLVMIPRVEPTCYEVGKTAGAYCKAGKEDINSCPACKAAGKAYSLEPKEIPMIPHTVTPSEIQVTWNEKRTECTASAPCRADDCNQTVTETVAANMTEKVPETCEVDGYTTYTSAKFANESLLKAGFQAEQTKTDTITKRDHDWTTEVKYVWTENNTVCTATQVCKNNTCNSCTRTDIVRNIVGNVTNPTCTDGGYTTYNADFQQKWCEDQTKQANETPATGHSWKINGAARWNMTGDVVTCTADLVCEHDNSHTAPNVAATVTETGREPAYCDKAGKITYTATFDEQWKLEPVTGEKGIPVLPCEWTFAEPDWKWDEATQTYTCTMTKTCTKHSSGSHQGTNTVQAVPSEDTATCTEPGKIIYTATFASDEFGVQTHTVNTPALGHDVELVEEVSPTCKKTGVEEHFECTVCEKLFKTEADAENNITVDADDLTMTMVDHRYTSYTYNGDASCTKPGTKTAFCDFGCGTQSIINDTEYPQLDHAWGEYSYNNDATCQHDGTKTAYCTYECGTSNKITAENTQLKHDYVETVLVAPTCTAVGTMEYTCKNGCNHRYTEEIPKLGHAYALKEGKEATCYAEGWNNYYQCAATAESGERTYFCGLYFAKSGDTASIDLETWKTGAGQIAKAPHVYESVVTAPTCLEQGYTTYTCKNCTEGIDGHSYVDNYQDALKHNYNDGEILPGDEPTCTAAGEMTFTCQNDCCTAETEGHTRTESVAALGHSLVPVEGKAASCDAPGYNACYQCTAATRSGERSYCDYYFASETDTAAGAEPIATNASTLATWRTTAGKIEQRVCVDADYNHECDYEDCTRTVGAHVDVSPKDHICDAYGERCTLGRIGGECSDADTDNDHNCDYCGETIGKHEFESGVCNCGYVQDLTVTITIKAEGQNDHNVPVADIKYGNDGKNFTQTLDLETMFNAPCYTIKSVSAKVGGADIESEYEGNTLTIAADALTGNVEIIVNAHQAHKTDAQHTKVTTKDATCEQPGEKKTVLTCVNCGTDYDSYTEVIPAKNHDWVESYVDPTFDADGYTLHHCKNDSSHDYKVIDEDTKLIAVARIGSTRYQTLEAAIEAARNRNTIELLTKCVVEGTQVWDKNITILLPNDDVVGYNYGLIIKGDLTIKDGTIVISSYYGIGVQPTGKLTIDGGTFELDRGVANDYLIGSWGETVINDGQFVGQYNCVNGFAGSLTINGGEFETAEFDATGEYPSLDVVAGDNVAQVKGGTFSKEVYEVYLADGYCQVESRYGFEVAAHEPGEAFRENEKAASCETDGSYELVTKCERCDAELSRDPKVIPATGHTVEVIAGKDADCLNPGYYQAYHCTVCDGYYAERNTENDKLLSGPIGDADALAAWQTTGDGKIDALGHKLVHTAEDPATCEESGVKEYWQCERCDAAFEDKQETESIADLAAWMAEGGDGYIGATGHNYTSEVTTKPTCMTDGVRTYTCQNDNSHSYTEAEPKLNHNYVVSYNWNAERTACTASAVCANDPNHYAQLTASVTVSVTTAAGCETTGAGIRTAAFPENVYGIENQDEDVVIPATGHSFTDYKADGNNTCTEDGTKTATCDHGCGKTDTVANTGAAKGHQKQEIPPVPATCTNDGIIHHYLCGVCLVRFYDEACTQPIEDGKFKEPALQHEYTTQVIEPDCENQGYTIYTCIRGDHTYNADFKDALNHDYDWADGKVVTPPTCTEDGHTTYTCSRCGETHIGDGVPATKHDYEYFAGKSADCTQPGWKAYYKCKNSCGLYYDQVLNQDAGWEYVVIGDDDAAVESWKTGAGKIEPYGHTYQAVAGKTPDCDDAGYLASFKCTKFGSLEYFTEDENGEKVLIGGEADYTAWISDGGAGYVQPNGHKPGEVKTENVVAPKCEVDGSHDEVIYCTVCTDKLSSTTVVDPQTGHPEDKIVHYDAKDPDCVNTGMTAGEFCSVCEKWLVEQTVIKANGHTEVIDPAVDSTCTETGLTQGSHCEVCGEKLVVQTVVPKKAHNHSVSVSITPASCDVDGSQIMKCATCDDTITNILKAPGHNSNGIIPAVAPTCTETGLTEGKKCTACNTTQVEQEVIPATGHLHVTATPQVDTSCEASGLKAYYFCDDCDTYYATSNSEDHKSLSDKIGNAKALETWKLTVGDKGGKIEKLPHTEETIPAIAPNCTDDGMKAGVKCSVCETILVEPVVDPATGHTRVIDKEKLPTCTETGLTAGVHCAVCPAIIQKQEPVPATGHRSVVKTEQKDATCLADGIKAFYYCDDCATFYATRSEEDETILSDKIGGPADLANWKFAGGKINKLDHTIEILPAVAPSCEETGLTKGEKCSVCKTVLIPQDVVPATDHTVVIDNKVDPTCTATGLTEGKHCSACTKVLEPQVVVPAKGHAPELVKGLAAKCEADGWKDYYQCKECKAYFEDEAAKLPIEDLDAWKIGAGKLPQFGHKWDEGRETTLATCTTEGVITYTCSNCNGTYTGVKAALGHETEVHPAQHPTYYSAGWNEYETCKRCDHNTFTGIPALGEPSVSTFEEFMTSLQYLEDYANDYAKANPGKDPMLLLIKYVRTGVDRYNSGSWNIMAGYEDEGFAEYVRKQEEAYNKAVPTRDDMINVTGIKNIANFKLPNGDKVDFGHMFGTMDITYHNKTSINHADVGGWAGDLVDLLSTADRHDVTGTVDEMIVEIGRDYLTHSIEGESDQFSHTDMYGDLDGYYVMNELLGSDYEPGMLYDLMSDYFVASLDDEQRADYFLKNRLGGVTSRSDIRDAVFREYTGNQVIATLEGTREFKQEDVSDLRKACNYAFADYLCKLAGDYVELGENTCFSVFSSETSTLAPGIVQQINKATMSDGKQVVYYTATGDVTSPYVSVYANYKDNDPASGWGMQRVRDQANAAQAKYGDPSSEYYIPNYNIIATINGAGYNMSTGEPGGVLMMGGVEYHAPNGGGFFGIRKDGTACLGSDADYYALKEKGELSEAIAIFGSTLVKDGKLNVTHNDYSRASRTAIGYTKTGKVVFMVMDGRQEPVSCGGSMAEIAQVMLEAGCVWAVNLDGGGSTTYLARQEGDSELSLVSSPSDGFERSVATSWIMVSTAPSSTAFDHAALDSEVRHMTIGATVQVTAAGVSATGNPVDLPEGATWAVSDPTIASISEDGVVTGLANGTFEVQLKLGDEIIGTRTMYVVIPDAVYFTKENMNAVYGEPADLPVAALFEGKPVAITENDASFTLSNDEAGTTEGYTFIGSEEAGIKNVRIFAHAVKNPNATSGSMGINLFRADEAAFDFENIDGGDRLLAWKREVSNSTTVDSVTYTAVDKEQPMVTEYTFGMDMTQIPMPEKLTDLVFMLPGADVEGNNSAWDFLLQLAERVSVLTEVKATLNFDPNFEVDYSQMSVNCEYFGLEKAELDPVTNQLVLSLRWKDQTKAIDPNTANPIVILAGIKLTPKADAAWNSKQQLEAVHTGNISYDIYLRANALYSFANKPENQEAYDLYPFINNDVIINGAPESGGHFADTYKEFNDEYTLNKGLKNGWFYEDGGYAYYEEGVKYTGIRKVGQYYYDFGTNGINMGQTKYTGMFQIDGINHYAKDGLLTGGWFIDGDDKYYFDENGRAVDGEFVLDEVKMIFDNGLHVGGYSGFLKKTDGKTYYYQNGSMTFGWVEVGDDLYHFNTDNGTMTTGTHVIPDDEARAKGAYYDFADDGRTLRGYFNGFGYYYWAGLPKRDAWVKEGSDPDPEAWYHTNNTGHYVTSGGKESYKLELNGVTYDAVKIAYDGVVYVFDDHSGKLLLGSMVLEDGFWYYYWAGAPVNDGWFEFEGETFYAFEDGKLASGIQNIDGESYMFTDRGALIKDGITLSIAMNNNRTQMTIKTNRIYKDMERVTMAVWSDENGQDDLKWFDATCDDNGVWSVVIDPLCQYRSTGRYQIHVYEAEKSGQLKDILVNTIYDLSTIGHNTNEPVKMNVVAPDCDTIGGYDLVTICKDCEQAIETVHVEEPALGHTAGEPVKMNVVAPTCVSAGSYDLVTSCKVCEQVINTVHVDEPALANGHVYDDKVDGTCNICGVDRATVTYRKKHNMLRMYNPYNGEHFYTGSEEEKDNLVAAGWKYEGIAFTFPANTGAPVHRLYEPVSGEHLYTMSEEEKADLLAKGWNYEGVAFNSAYDTEAVQHRLHNPYATRGGGYHFTFSQEEVNNLIAAGWIYQGIGWYSCFK